MYNCQPPTPLLRPQTYSLTPTDDQSSQYAYTFARACGTDTTTIERGCKSDKLDEVVGHNPLVQYPGCQRTCRPVKAQPSYCIERLLGLSSVLLLRISFYIFQVSSASMAVSLVLTLLAAIMKPTGPIQQATTNTQFGFAPNLLGHPTLSLSCAICTVAYLHYSQMAKSRQRAVYEALRSSDQGLILDNAIVKDSIFTAYVMRTSDWAITMPLLAVEMLALAATPAVNGEVFTQASGSWAYEFCKLDGFLRSPGGALTDGSILAVTLLASFMILAGSTATLLTVPILPEWDYYDRRTTVQVYKTSIWSCGQLVSWALGCLCLLGLYVITFGVFVCYESKYRRTVYFFSLLWALYAVVFFLRSGGFIHVFIEEILYSLLDISSKSIFVMHLLLLQ